MIKTITNEFAVDLMIRSYLFIKLASFAKLSLIYMVQLLSKEFQLLKQISNKKEIFRNH
jgi:hypothetical protein